MTGYTCVQLREVAPELALSVLGGAERAEALIHLTNCSRCQAFVAELTEAADTLPLLAAEHEPPAGFERRVINRLGARRRRNVRRLAASVAVAAAAAAIVSIVIVRVVDAQNPVAVPTAATPALAQAHMVSASTGAPAGWAYVSGGRSVAVGVDYGVDAGSYDIEVKPERGERVLIGDITIDAGRGSWMGTSTVDVESGSEISLVDADGAQVCLGTVETTR